MILLVDGHAHGDRPIRVAFVTIAVRGVVAMTVFLEVAYFAIVGDSNGMKTVRPAVGSHVAGLGHPSTDSGHLSRRGCALYYWGSNSRRRALHSWQVRLRCRIVA